MPFIEVFTREPLDDSTREKLAQALSKTMETVEFSYPTEHAQSVDWMWFHTQPADMWAVGGRFDDKYVKGRKMALARIISPEALMNPELKARAMEGVAKDLREALGISSEDATGIFVHLIEVTENQWFWGNKIITVQPLIDFVDGEVSKERRDAIDAKFKGQEKCKEAFGIPY